MLTVLGSSLNKSLLFRSSIPKVCCLLNELSFIYKLVLSIYANLWSSDFLFLFLWTLLTVLFLSTSKYLFGWVSFENNCWISTIFNWYSNLEDLQRAYLIWCSLPALFFATSQLILVLQRENNHKQMFLYYSFFITTFLLDFIFSFEKAVLLTLFSLHFMCIHISQHTTCKQCMKTGCKVVWISRDTLFEKILFLCQGFSNRDICELGRGSCVNFITQYWYSIRLRIVRDWGTAS